MPAFYNSSLYFISIHRPHAGPDVMADRIKGITIISIHRPLAGPDLPWITASIACFPFQSTGPSRGPTVSSLTALMVSIFQSTGPSRGPTVTCSPCACLCPISIHRPLAGPDRAGLKFLEILAISIHRPLAGPDTLRCSSPSAAGHFNPQAPRGARRRRRRRLRCV